MKQRRIRRLADISELFHNTCWKEDPGNSHRQPSDASPGILQRPGRFLHASACGHVRTPVQDSG